MFPPKSTSNPPFVQERITPETGVFALNAAEISFHRRLASAFVLEISGPLRPNFLTKNT